MSRGIHHFPLADRDFFLSGDRLSRPIAPFSPSHPAFPSPRRGDMSIDAADPSSRRSDRLGRFAVWSREKEFFLARGAAHALRNGGHALRAPSHAGNGTRARAAPGGARRASIVSTPRQQSATARAGSRTPRWSRPTPLVRTDTPLHPRATPRARQRTRRHALTYAMRGAAHALAAGRTPGTRFYPRTVASPAPRAGTNPRNVRGPPTLCTCPPTPCLCFPTRCASAATCCVPAGTLFHFSRTGYTLGRTPGVSRTTARLRRRTLHARIATPAR